MCSAYVIFLALNISAHNGMIYFIRLYMKLCLFWIIWYLFLQHISRKYDCASDARKFRFYYSLQQSRQVSLKSANVIGYQFVSMDFERKSKCIPSIFKDENTGSCICLRSLIYMSHVNKIKPIRVKMIRIAAIRSMAPAWRHELVRCACGTVSKVIRNKRAVRHIHVKICTFM
jgi:hypothetical protein